MIVKGLSNNRLALYEICSNSPPSIQYITSVLSLNKVLEVIYEETNELRGCVNGKEDSRNENPLFSTPNRAVLEPILADLDRLWEMRHWIPEPGKSIIPEKL